MNTQENIKYKCILADPPWNMQQHGTRGACRHYPLMTLEAIKAMPVSDLADPDGCHLWLWATNASLKDAYTVMEAWGFENRGILA